MPPRQLEMKLEGVASAQVATLAWIAERRYKRQVTPVQIIPPRNHPKQRKLPDFPTTTLCGKGRRMRFLRRLLLTHLKIVRHLVIAEDALHRSYRAGKLQIILRDLPLDGSLTCGEFKLYYYQPYRQSPQYRLYWKGKLLGAVVMPMNKLGVLPVEVLAREQWALARVLVYLGWHVERVEKRAYDRLNGRKAKRTLNDIFRLTLIPQERGTSTDR